MSNYLSTQILPVRDPVTYSRAPLPPGDEASWLAKSISQPYFPAVNINLFVVPPVNVGTYFTGTFPGTGLVQLSGGKRPQPMQTVRVM